MKNSLQKQFFQTIKVVVLGLLVGLGANYAFAINWNPPTQAPTGGNTAAPINVSGTVQEKTGGLILASGSGITNGLYVTHGNVIVADANGKVGIGTAAPTQKLDVSNGYVRGGTGLCIGNDCRTAWPTGSGGGSSDGPGTIGRVAKFIQADKVGDSIIRDTGTNVGVGTDPTEKLDVNGLIRIRGGSPDDNHLLMSVDTTGKADWRKPQTVARKATASESGGGSVTATVQCQATEMRVGCSGSRDWQLLDTCDEDECGIIGTHPTDAAGHVMGSASFSNSDYGWGAGCRTKIDSGAGGEAVAIAYCMRF